MKPFLILLLLFGVVSAFAQNRTFRWQDELCTYEGTYDASKTTLAELQNTLKLARPGSYTLETNVVVWKFSDIARIDLKALDLEYNKKSAELRDLKIVKGQYWQDLKNRKLRELEQVYTLERTTMRGYREPGALLEYKGAPECVAKFGEPVSTGGESLLKVWRTVNEESRTKNADPERLKRIFENQFKSPDKLQYALLEVMAFGWSNCANELIEYVNYDGTADREYKKLFTKVRAISCDEP